MTAARTQCQQIAKFLQKPGARLTSLEALRLFGTSRLAARILDLKQSGVAIEAHMVTVITTSGTARVAEYSLAKEPTHA